jgi:hypothetical protein
MSSVNSTNLLPAVVVGVVALRMYGRMRRNIGRQTLRPQRLVVRTAIYAVVTLALAVFSLMNQRLLLGLGAGLAIGVPLAFLGLSLTKFESTPEGRFYTPNPYIGGALTILLAGRLVYRLIVLSNISQNAAQAPTLMHSALTLCVFGLLAGYYITYSIGVLARSRTVST